MDRSSISFETWCNNHDDNHSARWCRELYPWEVFQRIGYDDSLVGVEQELSIGECRYKAVIVSRYVGTNERTNYKIKLSTVFQCQTQSWFYRAWDDLFHLVEAPGGSFITLYTEKKDPSLVVVKKFFGSRFGDIENVRSLPVSGLLFRSLISNAAHEFLTEIKRYDSFPVTRVNDASGQRPFVLKSTTYEPFLSLGRKLWIAYSFNEEKAHRLAIRLAGQSDQLYVVYCHPTFTRHHRSSQSATHVISLSQFLRFLSPVAYVRYLQPARFLINHLRLPAAELRKEELKLSRHVIEQVQHHTEQIKITTSELREAKGGLGILVTTAAEAAYVCACANLLNAALNRGLASYGGSINLSKDVYSFKQILGRAVEEIIVSRINGVSVYVGHNNLIYIFVRGIQFSFHAIPRTSAISEFQESKSNVPQEWSGIRLQPIAPLILNWARCLLYEEGSTAGELQFE